MLWVHAFQDCRHLDTKIVQRAQTCTPPAFATLDTISVWHRGTEKQAARGFVLVLTPQERQSALMHHKVDTHGGYKAGTASEDGRGRLCCLPNRSVCAQFDSCNTRQLVLTRRCFCCLTCKSTPQLKMSEVDSRREAAVAVPRRPSTCRERQTQSRAYAAGFISHTCALRLCLLVPWRTHLVHTPGAHTWRTHLAHTPGAHTW